MKLAAEVEGDLTDQQRVALEAIVGAEEAWSSVAALGLHDVAPEKLDELLALDLVVRWEPALAGPGVREELVTLSTWGAYVLGVEIDERMTVDESEELEVPHWVKLGRGSGSVVLPRHARGYRLPFPDQVPDERPGPEHEHLVHEVFDEATGRWTVEPVVLWGRMIPLRSDRRRKGRPKRSA